MDFLIGATSACCAVVISNPFDVIKTRMQLQGELKYKGQYKIIYRNTFHAAYTIMETEGIRAVQKGLLPALAYQVALNGTRLGLYQQIMDSGLISRKDGSASPLGCILAGAAVGAAGASFGSPLYLVKVQLQVQSNDPSAVGHQHKHPGAFVALKSIFYKDGVKGLWRGLSTAIPRAGVGSAAQLFTYTKSKDWLDQINFYPRDSWQSTLVAAFMSGIIVTCCMSPFDVVSSRVYNQAVDHSGKGVLYKGVLSCLVKTIQAEGVIGLYKGWTPLYLRLGPHSFFNLVIWDKLKKMHKKLKSQQNED